MEMVVINESAVHSFNGRRVVRGKDWIWGSQDGNGPGTIDSYHRRSSGAHWVWVKWDSGTRDSYRAGPLSFDLYFADDELEYTVSQSISLLEKLEKEKITQHNT